MARRWLYSTVLVLALGSAVQAQRAWTLRSYVGIGIGASSMASLADYANVVGGPTGKKVEDFQSLFDLNGGVEIHISEGWAVGLDYVSASRTIETNLDQPGAGWVIEPSLRMPTMVVRRLYESPTITYGFGGGFGYYYGTLVLTPPGLLVGTTYTGTGMGVLAEAVAYTSFDESFSGMIAVDVRWTSIASLKDDNGNRPRTGNGIEATLQTFSIALRFGISFQL